MLLRYPNHHKLLKTDTNRAYPLPNAVSTTKAQKHQTSHLTVNFPVDNPSSLNQSTSTQNSTTHHVSPFKNKNTTSASNKSLDKSSSTSPKHNLSVSINSNLVIFYWLITELFSSSLFLSLIKLKNELTYRLDSLKGFNMLLKESRWCFTFTMIIIGSLIFS